MKEYSLLQAIEASDPDRASDQFRKELGRGARAREIHLSLYPVVQRVLNPPFINPHLPKMYAISRELQPLLREEEVPELVRVEVIEYARRPKLRTVPKPGSTRTSVPFADIESAIQEQDTQKTADLMSAFHSQKGGEEFCRRLLLLGSGYLPHSLGHSISCTAFILREMLERADQDSWPAIATLADYFCKGRFHKTPVLQEPSPPSEPSRSSLLRATSGQGIINLHHTITIYAIEGARRFFKAEELGHLIGSWDAFMGDKEVRPVELDSPGIDPPSDYARFYEMFSELDAKSVAASLAGLLASQEGRTRLGRYLVKGVVDQYNGNYNPHYFTGLGSVLWVVNRYWNESPLVLNALHQYIDFFFQGTRT